jgi:cation:H+ antiporter
LVILDVLYKRETLYSRAAQGHILSAALGALLIAFAGFNLLLDHTGMTPALWHVGLYSPFIVLVYIAAMRSIHRYEQRTLDAYTEKSTERYPHVTLRQAITGYSLAAAAVIAAGSWLPFVATELSELMGWGQSFVGTLLVAAVTSAPEVAVTISALRIGAIDMAIANLLGSNLFDIFILVVDDLFYTKGPLLANVDTSHSITAFTAVMMSLLAIAGFIFRPQQRAVLKLTWVSLGLLLLYILNAWIMFQHG